MLHGIVVHEALCISEVLSLAQQHPEAQIVITPDVDPAHAKEIQQHYPTITLKSGATAQDVIFSGNGNISIQ